MKAQYPSSWSGHTRVERAGCRQDWAHIARVGCRCPARAFQPHLNLRILTERAPVTPEMALRLGKLCGNGREIWLALQARFDLDRLTEARRSEIDAIPTLVAE
jgi:hypothetical protein